MTIYRVTFATDLLVEADVLSDAVHIGHANLEEEVRNRCSKHLQTVIITSVDQLQNGERRSLPWRDYARRNEPEVDVNTILTDES